jgi:hypothetical protein
MRDVIDQVELSSGGGDRAPRRLARGGWEERISVATVDPLRKLFLHLRVPHSFVGNLGVQRTGSDLTAAKRLAGPRVEWFREIPNPSE